MKNSDISQDTKNSVLNAAIDIFASKGYAKTKISDICDAANANVSAVNYYFQSKDNLYLEVWKILGEEYSRRIHAILQSESNSVKALEEIIKVNISDLLCENKEGMLTRISYYELGNPSPVFDEIERNYFHPNRILMKNLLLEILGENVDDFTLRLAAVCIREPIYGLINMLLHNKQNEEKNNNEREKLFKPEDLRKNREQIVTSVTKFIIGGLRTLSRQ